MMVREAMTRDVQIITPSDTVQSAAMCMASLDAGSVPVADGDRLVGMVTDRDIAVRAVAAGRGPQTPVGEIMTGEVKYCFEDQDIEDVARNMADIQVRRLPVVNRDKRLVGIIALGDIAVSRDGDQAGVALSGISQPASFVSAFT